MTEYFIGNLASGRRLLSLPVLTGPWNNRIHVAESITATVDMNDPDVQALGLRSAATPGQAFLAVVEDGNILGAGPIWTRKWNGSNHHLELGAAGIGSYFNHRLILPLLAMTIGVDQWTVPDPADDTKTIPNPLLSSTYSGVSLATIAKRLVQQARLFTGGAVPIVFQPDEADSNADHTRTYLGANFKPVWEAISDLMNVIDGPEVNFQPRFTADNQGVEWLMQTGTVAQPLITSNSSVSWNVTAPESAITDFAIAEDATGMGSLAWQVGGKQADTVLVSRAYDPSLINANYPLMELIDTSHSAVSLQPTLDAYAQADVVAGRMAGEVWSFSVLARPTDEDGNPSGPQIGQYAVGDFADLIFVPWNQETGEGDPYLPEGGTFHMRIVGLSGDESGLLIKVDCAPIVRI